jgi:hypothetical protein
MKSSKYRLKEIVRRNGQSQWTIESRFLYVFWLKYPAHYGTREEAEKRISYWRDLEKVDVKYHNV